jgi:hypothetical protein
MTQSNSPVTDAVKSPSTRTVFDQTKTRNVPAVPNPTRIMGCIARFFGRIDGRYSGKSGKAA